MSDTSPPPIIEMCDVTVASLRDASLPVIQGVNWAVSTGEFWVVGGQQHSGKSDLLMLAAGLMNPLEGTARRFGLEADAASETQLAERLRVGFVFQSGNLFNRLNIGDNVALPLRYHHDLPAAEAGSLVAEILELTELQPFAEMMPSNVAAVWRHRAALARALILRPELLLLDNPLTGLGARHRYWLLQFLDQLWRGHPLNAGRPLTLAVTTDDLRPWRDHRRKFALLHDKRFVPLGDWAELQQNNHPTLKELMAELDQTTK